ncbi:MAG: STAS domain-containing protein [Candidatus Eisenbacteria bacterium]
MPVRHEVNEKDGIVFFELTGYLTGHADSYEFLDDAKERIAGGAKSLIVDLSGVEKVNSSGIGVLAAVISSATNAGAAVRFARVPDKVWNIMCIVGLSRVVKNFETVEDAVADL